MTPKAAIKSARQIIAVKIAELQAEVSEYDHEPLAPHFIRHKRRVIRDYTALLSRPHPTPEDKKVLTEILRQRVEQHAFAAKLFKWRPADASEEIRAEALEWETCTEAYSVLRY